MTVDCQVPASLLPAPPEVAPADAIAPVAAATKTTNVVIQSSTLLLVIVIPLCTRGCGPRALPLGDHRREPLEWDAGTRVRFVHQLLSGCLEQAEKRLVRGDDGRPEVAHRPPFARQLDRRVVHPHRPLLELVNGAARPVVLDEVGLSHLYACSFRHASTVRRQARGRNPAFPYVCAAANTRRTPSMPFSSCSPRSSNSRPEPATRSRVVELTSTSPAPARAMMRAPMTSAMPRGLSPALRSTSPLRTPARTSRPRARSSSRLAIPHRPARA